jgi:hypothetical protein
MTNNKYIFTVSNQTPLLLNQSDEYNCDIIVAREDEDDKPPHCFLTSPHLTELKNPEEIWARALALIQIYNGSNNLLYNPNREYETIERQKISKIYVWEDYSEISPNRTLNILPSQPFDNKLIDFPVTKTMVSNDKLIKLGMVKANKRIHAIYLSKSNDDVKNLLLQLGNGLDWINLFCILDTIKYYSSLINKKFFDETLTNASLTSADIKAFRATANNFGLIGLSARHGNLGWSPPKRIADLEESRSTIVKLVNSYLNLKYSV